MCVDTYTHTRHIVLHHFEKGWRAAQSFRDLNELFGEGTISESRYRKWFEWWNGNKSQPQNPVARHKPYAIDAMHLLQSVIIITKREVKLEKRVVDKGVARLKVRFLDENKQTERFVVSLKKSYHALDSILPVKGKKSLRNLPNISALNRTKLLNNAAFWMTNKLPYTETQEPEME
uniref:HTH_48 domain-containing protein n=1 Tax=Glossina austeni TaxID=7395 RepID=A0A1A9V908_GLOAU